MKGHLSAEEDREYRDSLKGIRIPEVCESFSCKSLKSFSHKSYYRVTGYYCPVIWRRLTTIPVPVIRKQRGKYDLRMTKNHSYLIPSKTPGLKVNTYDDNEWIRDSREIFWEPDSNWEKGIRLKPCLKEEATHVSGAGVCGVIVCINKIKASGKLVPWSEELINEEKERVKRWAEYFDLFHTVFSEK